MLAFHNKIDNSGNDKMGSSNAPLADLKSAKLKQAVQSYKQLEFTFNMVEIAHFAGISPRGAYNYKDEIVRFWNEESLTPDADKQFAHARCLELAQVQTDGLDMEKMFGAILGVSLKTETAILDSADSLKEIWKLGEQMTKIYRRVCSYKNPLGVPVHSGSKSGRYLLEAGIHLDELFSRSKNYVPGLRARRWKATDLLNGHVKTSVEKLLDVLSEWSISDSGYIGSHMYTEMCAKTDSTNNIVYNNTYNTVYCEKDLHTFSGTYENKDMAEINIHVLKDFDINSVFHLLIRTTGISQGKILVPIKHDGSTDESLGRSYNVFCRLRSQERLKLGFISYDMSAALQTISLHLIGASEAAYPMLWKYTHDKAYKKHIRAEIAQALTVDEEVVKKKLTAYANGSVTGIKQHKHYKAFQEESDRLRRTVLKHVEQKEPEVFKRAREQSRRELPEELDWSDTERKETPEEMRNTASVFFFVWTWYERLIRKAMLTVLPGGIELHDAVYSKADVPVEVVQDAIRTGTGFDIRIEKQMPG